MAEAKLSKNDPTKRRKAGDIMFNGKKVKPALFIGPNGKYMAIADDGGNLQYAAGAPEDQPLSWDNIKNAEI